jgi:hypothetical protein
MEEYDAAGEAGEDAEEKAEELDGCCGDVA